MPRYSDVLYFVINSYKTLYFSPIRYKMISEFTWPNHDLPSDKEAVKRLLQGCGFQHDVAYGKTKVFIRTPRTIFSLEEQRAEMVKRIVLFLQKVGKHHKMCLINELCIGT